MKIALRFHLIPVRMATIKETKDDKCWNNVGKEHPLVTVHRSVNLCSHYEKSTHGFKKKLNIELPHDADVPLLCIYPENSVSYCTDIPCTPAFIAAVVTIAKIWNHINSSVENEMWPHTQVCTHV